MVFILCCLGVSWLAALFLHGPAEILIVSLVLPLLAALMLLAWRAPPRVTLAGGLLGAWWLYLAVSCLWSSAPFVSSLFLLLLAPLPGLYLAVVAAGRARADALATAAICGLALLALATVGQFLAQGGGARIHAPFLDPNTLAAAMTLGLLPCFILYLQAQTSQIARRHAALTLLFAAGLLATQSRGGMLATLATTLVMLPRAPRAAWRRTGLMAAAGLALSSVMELYGRLAAGHGPSRHLVSTVAGNFTDRLSLWSSSLRMIAAHPFAGTGLGTFSYWYPRYRLPADHSDGYFAHNDLLQFWSESGVIAPVLFLLFAVVYLKRFFRARRVGPDAAALAGPAVLLALLLQALVSYEFYLPALLLPLAVLLAWSETAPPTMPVLSTNRLFLYRMALLVCVLFAGQWTLRAAIGIDATRLAAVAEQRGDAGSMAAALRPAWRFAPTADFAVPQYEARHAALLAAQGDGSDIGEGLQQIDRAAALNRGFAYLDVTRAQLLAAAQADGTIPDGRAQAAELLTSVLADDPLCLEARYRLSALDQQVGDYRAAMDVIGEGLNWPRATGTEKPLLTALGRLCAINGNAECTRTLGARLNEKGESN